jgi:hypothetical protein
VGRYTDPTRIATFDATVGARPSLRLIRPAETV